ncbi:MAG: strictosidine synthase [Shinella sp.]|nr:strictosidine synthase [Shinella sp.]
MIASISRAIDRILGRGEAAVTLPALDGALRPNRALDEADWRRPLPGVDCIAVHKGSLVVSAGQTVYRLAAGGAWESIGSYEASVSCIAPVDADSLAVALHEGAILIQGGRFDGRRYKIGSAKCITAMAASGEELYVANGSASNGPDEWQTDLMQCNASGSIWRLNLETGVETRLADGLAWPAGIAIAGSDVVFSESWRHRIVRVVSGGPRETEVLYADLPGYPGRLSSFGDGWWLAVFAPRSQLVEFILREPAYRERMMAEVPQPFWVAPKLRSGRSYYEPLQGGAVKHLGLLKPWAPAMSRGMCVWLDASFQPRSSLQSRADGNTHGITSIIDHAGETIAVSRGDNVVVGLRSPALGLGSSA